MQQAVKIRCQRMICSVLSMSHLLHGPPLGLCDDLLWVLPAGMRCCERCYLCCQHCSLWSWCWWGDRTRWITGLQCYCCDYSVCVYLCGCYTKSWCWRVERQDGSLGCSVVAVITACVSVRLWHKKADAGWDWDKTRWITGLQCFCCDYSLCICVVVIKQEGAMEQFSV